MKARLTEHVLSIVFVTVILIGASVLTGDARKRGDTLDTTGALEGYGDLSFVDFDRSFERALLVDVLTIYFPEGKAKHVEDVETARRINTQRFTESLQHAHVEETLTREKFGELIAMYLKFLAVFGIVMALTYYGVQTLGVWWFIRKKSKYDQSRPLHAKTAVMRVVTAMVSVIAYVVLFSPAYVIAYSIRTKFSTDTLPFMILLGVVSNGLLVTYANKFYTFLVAESRKGYVETARAKNLHDSYERHAPDGIALKAILRPRKRFDGHIFDHIFRNARLQYLSTIKEQASFLITGLIIIEMALNIQGHLSYELLRQMLHRNYDIVIAIILGIFYAVKLAEIMTDWIVHRENLRYADA
ncbi:MAG: hypothetical protein GF344_04240 [Chitinivibrionales bacterium]|nr:hypothetical protein [Chitinivibrionales bacterium]MBD3356254.1 hypothetical protein [Chitinivibrionales bacterium]